jgi:endonuclease/exonuclease/phosphatase family metal-dependent hydrolase
LLFMLLGSAGCDPFHTRFAEVEAAVLYQARQVAPPPALPDQLRVMTWNIKFSGARLAFFYECNGTRGWMTEDEVVRNLEGLAAKIRQVDPDILLLQEIDAVSKRGAYIDQVQWLLDHTDLSYGAYASQWKADYIPSDGLGRMDSGNAILSRWPFAEAERIALPLAEEQSALTRYFYLKRNILKTRLDVDGLALHVLDIHTEAFSAGARKRHLERFEEALDALDAAGAWFVAGGDLNSIPRGSPSRRDFPDDCDDARFEGDDYTGEDDWLDGLYARYAPAVSLDDFAADPDAHLTFSGDERVFWTRKLDYLFTNGTWVAGTGITHQSEARGGMETLSLSDHAPVSAVLEVTR